MSKNEKSAAPIDSIEALALPKRQDRRRTVYLNERIHCEVMAGGVLASATMVDISTFGMALVQPIEARNKSLSEKSHVHVFFKKAMPIPFAIEATIVNGTQVRLGKKIYWRVGLKFRASAHKVLEDFQAALPEDIYKVRSAVSPQVYTQDPFFFNETVLLQVIGIGAEGLELGFSARCKTMIPGQRLKLDVYVPGRGTFVVDVENGLDIYRPPHENRLRIFAKYLDHATDLRQALSEYLMMFSSDASPVKLRQEGFVIGPLTNALEISHKHPGEDAPIRYDLKPTHLAKNRGKLELDDDILKNSRPLCCKVGPHIAAVVWILFPEGNINRSLLYLEGYRLPSPIAEGSYLEIAQFMISPHANLVDCLIPILQHVIRIAVQSRTDYVCLCASGELADVLKKVGFRVYTVDGKKDKLLVLGVKEILSKTTIIPEKVWSKVYEKLYAYLRRFQE